MNVRQESTQRAMQTGARIAYGVCVAAFLVLAPWLLSESVATRAALASIAEKLESDHANITEMRADLKILAQRMSALETGVARIEERTRIK